MRINKFVAQATGLSRRAADAAIEAGKLSVNDRPVVVGEDVKSADIVTLDGQRLVLRPMQTVLLHKPVGYVCSRRGQGSKTIYDLLPTSLHHLKPVGRLDKDSSGLLVMTNDGELANQLTHPSYSKQKAYNVSLDKELLEADRKQIEAGVRLEDGISHLKLLGQGPDWTVTMSEGRNRQIRRTFSALGYQVRRLHRTHFGPFRLGALRAGMCQSVSTSDNS